MSTGRKERTNNINAAIDRYYLRMPHTIHASESGLSTAIPLKIRKQLIREGHPEAGKYELHELLQKYNVRADFIAWTNRPDGSVFTIVEVKSSWEDYRSDKKWKGYRRFCNKLYFAVDKDFPVEKLKQEIGDAGILLIENKWYTRVIKRAKYRELGYGVDKERLIFIISRRLYYQNPSYLLSAPEVQK